LNSRIFVLLALSLLFSGCTQITSLPGGSDSASPQEVSSSTGTSEVNTVEESASSDSGIEPASPTQASSETLVSSESIVSEATDSEDNVESAVDADSDVSTAELAQTELQQRSVIALCREIGNKLGSVSVDDCLTQPLAFAGSYTLQSRPMVVREFNTDEQERPRILILGGIHGDEYSSISIMFKWMDLLEQSEKTDFHWRFAPSVNPDGLLDGQAIRQNANGVDLNRNFPSEDWLDLAEEYWTNTTNRNPRRYPGTHPASEPEVQWIVDQIDTYKPDVIVSVHAPYHLLDYDGPPEPPQQLGELHLHLLGVYPGSLGNYAGINLGIPVVTMELPSAGIMPSNEQINTMWNDLQDWLHTHHEPNS
jgi:murein peptide amidase A